MDHKYEVRIELSKEMKSSFNIFDGIYIPLENKANNEESKLVPVSDFITLDPKMSAVNIIRYQQLRATSYAGQLAGKYNTGSAVSKITKMHRQNVPKDVFLEFTGDIKRFKEDSSNAFYILILSLLFIFLILAAQFESFVDPLLIILTVPCAIVGGVLLLWIVPGCSVNIYSSIGFVTLIGLITKHGILIIDYTNKYMENGMEAISSIKKACLTRIRPILMTTFAMVLGALPLAIASGSGSENRRQIGCVVVGGMIIGTLFTIIILPIILSFIKTSKKLIKKQ